MEANFAHIHLLLNHLPTIGFGIALCLYLVAYFTKNDTLKKTGLVMFFLVALWAIPTYISGNAAERVLCPDHKCPADVSAVAIRYHEDAALTAFIVMELTGFFAWLALWQLRQRANIGKWNWNIVLALALVSFGLMSLAANQGGDIRHSEIRAASEATGEYPGIARQLGAVVAGNTGVGFLWPTFETLHFIGLCLLFAVVLAVDLRILGMGKGIAFSSLYQLLPIGMLGFVINLITGMAFFLAAPYQYVNNPEFHRKIIFVILAGINVLYFMMVDEPWKIGEHDDAPVRAKLVAASAIFIWIGVLYYGHMLPFLGNAF